MMPQFTNRIGTSVQTDHTLNSHDNAGDVYTAALALVSLPKSCFADAKTDKDHSIITPQNSFDSFRISNISTPAESVQSNNSNCPHDPDLMTNKALILDLTTPSITKSAFYGSVPLTMPSDEDNLSPLHCFVRKYGIEAFVATESEAEDKDFWYARNFRVKPGIVGMRCMHCSSKPIRSRGPKSVHYPSSTKCIYYSMENWQRHHAAHCSGIPRWVLRDLKKLMAKSKTGSGGRRHYWADSAKLLGMVDTPDGVRFISNPEINALVEDRTSVTTTVQNDSSKTKASVPLLITTSDNEDISDYLFLLMSQMEACTFSEEDRTGSRSKIKNLNIDFPGMQCKHCNGKAGVGRYFPVSLLNLTLANSDRNMHNHLEKCRRCPEDTRRKLKKLRAGAQKPGRKIKRGARKTFFTRVWNRLHGTRDDESVSSSPSSVPVEMPNAKKGESNCDINATSTDKHGVPDLSTSTGSHSKAGTRTYVEMQSRSNVSPCSNHHRDTNNDKPVPMIQVNNYTNFTHPMAPMASMAPMAPMLPIRREGGFHSVHPHQGWANSNGSYNNDRFQFVADAQVRDFYCHSHNAGHMASQSLFRHQAQEFNMREYEEQVFTVASNRRPPNFAQL